MTKLTLQEVRVAAGEDADGRLVFADGWLVAVLVRLSPQHGSRGGHWFVEIAFGRLDGPEHPTFADLDSAQKWLAEQLTRLGGPS